MLQLRETTSGWWMVVDLLDGSAKSFDTYVQGYNYCVWSDRKFETYCKKGLLRTCL